MTKSDIYTMTAAGKKLFQVLIDPQYLGRNVDELCQIADVSRDTYYRLMKDERFTREVTETSRQLVMAKIGDVINATYENAIGERGHQDRKMLLTMAGLYADKQETNVTGSLDISNKSEVISKYLKSDADDS